MNKETTRDAMIRVLEEEGHCVDELAKQAGKLFQCDIIDPNDPLAQKVFMDDIIGLWTETTE